MQDLAGKTAVITGGASGIGFAMARRLGAQGMRIALADVEQGPLGRAEAVLSGDGVEVAGFVTDVSDAAAVDELAEKVLDRFGAVHVVCNNAGVGGGGRTWETSLEMWRWVLGVNLWGVIHGIRTFVPRLIAQGEGHVVNTASIAGMLSGPGAGPYNASKHAVVAISESLYHELALAASPVGVSVLCPGYVSTRIHEAARNWPASQGPMPAARDEEARERLRQAIEGGMDPNEVARLVHDAILSKRFWILTHEELNPRVLERYQRAVEGRNPEPVTPPPAAETEAVDNPS